MIAGYHSDNGWTIVPTKAEQQLDSMITRMYSEMYDMLREEKADQNQAAAQKAKAAFNKRI